MTPQEAIDQMIASGAVFWIYQGDLNRLIQTMGMARLVDGGMFWSSPYPDGQQDYHFLRFDGEPEIGDQQITFPGLNAGMMPCERVTMLPVDQQKLFIQNWNQSLADNRDQLVAAFDRILAEHSA